jgi:hypothetical protein
VGELGQQVDFSDRGFLRPFAFAAEVESRNHLLTQWAHEISPFVRRVVDLRRLSGIFRGVKLLYYQLLMSTYQRAIIRRSESSDAPDL